MNNDPRGTWNDHLGWVNWPEMGTVESKLGAVEIIKEHYRAALMQIADGYGAQHGSIYCREIAEKALGFKNDNQTNLAANSQ